MDKVIKDDTNFDNVLTRVLKAADLLDVQEEISAEWKAYFAHSGTPEGEQAAKFRSIMQDRMSRQIDNIRAPRT